MTDERHKARSLCFHQVKFGVKVSHDVVVLNRQLCCSWGDVHWVQSKDQSHSAVMLLTTQTRCMLFTMSPRTMHHTWLLTGHPHFLQRHTIMSKRKVKESHLPVGEAITKVGASWISALRSPLFWLTWLSIHRYFQLQDILRERFCRQQLPISPQGLEAPYK